ncbi:MULTISPECIES: DUF6998 domain-containing protein [Empedobacter]|uniref:DUF6998 domain-containing protein n=1 Tax=Empedobacter TaxID=59734 RepID=UPI0025BAEB07|nr:MULTISPECIES: hypothetical protein [unclassified Empedobacter]
MKKEIDQLFTVIKQLQENFKHHNKKFTLDGKLVGDIGEVLVAEYYGITLFSDNVPIYDGYVTKDDTKRVQIKASFNNYFYFTKDLSKIPDYYIAINISKDGTFEEIYNGRGYLIYEKLLKHLPTERKYPYRLSINGLNILNKSPENIDKITRIK